MEKTKIKKQVIDGVDLERINGPFLPVGSKRSMNLSSSVKELILENIGVILDDIMDELELEDTSDN